MPELRSSAHTSHLQISFGDERPVASAPSPGEVSDATDARLRELRRRVVDPVVRGLLADDELTSLSVHWGRDGTQGDAWVRLTARGEVFEDYLTAPDWGLADATSDQAGGPLALDLEAVARRLASDLEDWIAESGFGWGQQRQARYTLPS